MERPLFARERSPDNNRDWGRISTFSRGRGCRALIKTFCLPVERSREMETGRLLSSASPLRARRTLPGTSERHARLVEGAPQTTASARPKTLSARGRRLRIVAHTSKTFNNNSVVEQIFYFSLAINVALSYTTHVLRTAPCYYRYCCIIVVVVVVVVQADKYRFVSATALGTERQRKRVASAGRRELKGNYPLS